MINQAEIVFVRLCLPLTMGIVGFSNGASIGWLNILLGISGAVLLLLLVVNLHFTRFSNVKSKRVISACCYLFTFLMGGSLALANNQLLQANHFSNFNSDYLKVEISDEPRLKNSIITLRTKVLQSVHGDDIKSVSGQMLIALQVDSGNQVLDLRQTFSYGDQLIVPAIYKEVPEPLNPYEFDVQNWYNRQNIYHQMFIEANEAFSVKKGQGNSLIQWALNFRKTQVDLFRRLLHNNEAYAVASTLILGYRADLSEETLMAYSKTGTIHALSVSGMHVGLIYLTINFLLNFLNQWRGGRMLKLGLIITLVWLYTLLSGLSPSVLRAAIMLTVYVIGSTFNRHHNSYNLLCFSAFFLLLYNPFLIYDVGFQLSYLSVFGLVFLQPLIYKWFDFQNYAVDKIWNFFALSLAAQLATFPLAMYYFHQFPVFFLVSNLFILAPVSLIMYVGLAILMFRLEFIAPAFEWLIIFTNQGLKWIATLPFSSLSGIWISQTELLLLCSSILAACLGFSLSNKRLIYVSLIATCMLVLSFGNEQYQSFQQSRIIFFSIRNNAATAFIHRREAWLLTNLDTADKKLLNFVMPALNQAGIKQVSFLNLHKPFAGPKLQISAHQVRFMKYHVLIADSCFDRKDLRTRLRVNMLNLSQHTKLDLEELLKYCKTDQVIIDGSNAFFRAERFKTVAENNQVPVYDLREKKAYLINLTK